jgi:U3 small nucleolar RNA-associated protein 7
MQCQKSNILDIACHNYYMVTLGSEHEMKIWDIRSSFKPLFSYFSPDFASVLDVSQQGLLAVGGNKEVNIWKDWKIEK